MIDESKLIFLTGAPGSKWSAVANVLSMTPKIKINTHDRSPEREYVHPEKFNSASHLGSYFGPGFEFGEGWDNISQFSKQEILDEIDRAWEEPHYDQYRIVKSHCISNRLDWIAENFPTSKIIIVFRPLEHCFGGWFGAGGFNITYPDYHTYYVDDDTAKRKIEQELKDCRQWIFQRQLQIHTATTRHWADHWHITDSMNKWIKSMEGYFFHKEPEADRHVTYDTHIAYYNFDDIEPNLK